MSRLQMVQDRMDLEAALEAAEAVVDMSALEEGFVLAAARYGERKGISHGAWREVGVPAELLKRAGIGRG